MSACDTNRPAVQLAGVGLSFGRRAILSDVNLAFRSGEVAAILGPNGSGKSTTVKLICRSLVPDAGSVCVLGDDISQLTRKELARRVAVLPQGVPAPSMQVEQFVMAGRYPYRAALAAPTCDDKEIVKAAMRQAGCAALAWADMARLSGGERQRVNLARLLAQQARVVVMDEPTTYLDPTARFELMALARNLAQEGRAVVMVLHDISLALTFCDRVAVLAERAVQAFGTSAEVAASGAIDRVFGVRLRHLPPDPSDPDARTAYCLMPRCARSRR